MIAQILHLPYLTEIPEANIHALVDSAEERVNTLGDRYGVPHLFENVDSFLATVGDEIDAIIVLIPSHADVVVETLVEDADRMITAAARSDATEMVAYMKRYDPAYERAQETLDMLHGIDLITAYDVDPDHSR